MPLISTLAGAASRAYGFLSGVGRFFMGKYSAVIYRSQTATDSDGFLYLATDTSTSSYDAVFAKFNPTGTTAIYQKSSSNLTDISSLTSAGIGSVRITGIDKSSSDAVTISLDTNGSLGNSQKLSGTDVIGVGGCGVAAGSTWLLLNDTVDSLGTGAYVARYDSGSFIIWQKKLSDASLKIRFIDATADSSLNVYAVGYTSNSGGAINTVLVKYDSSGAIQWQKIFTTTQAIFPTTITSDSSANLYVGFDDAMLIKYNSSGAIQWQRKLTGSISGITVDSSGNVYATNSNSIYKFTSSGTANSQITVSSSGTLRNPTITETNAIFTAQDDTTVLFKLPTDGTNTGTYAIPGYASVTYSISSFSPTTPTYALTDSAYTSATSSLTDSSYSLSMTDLSATLNTVNFG